MRYIPHTPEDIARMLEAVGAKDVSEFFETIPEEFRLARPLDLPGPMTEQEVLCEIDRLARMNTCGTATPAFLGAGSYRHFIPSAVNQLLLRQEFYTSYTPYQPEISQGTLQAVFEFQTMAAGLLGLDVANASMYDGSTALAEGVLMARRIHKGAGKKAVVARSVHPEYREVLATYLEPAGDEVVEIGWRPDGRLDNEALEKALFGGAYCVAVQYPNFFGVVEDLQAVARAARAAGAVLVTATAESMALGILKSPGESGAVIATAEGQSLGVPQSFGGPGVGLFAAKKEFVRNMPGRLAGETTDTRGRRGYVLTLATREQHIRREKATSNICTNSGLNALAVTIYLSLMGPEGLRKTAIINHDRSEKAKAACAAAGADPAFSGPTFNEFVVRPKGDPSALVERSCGAGVIPGLALGRFYPELADCMLVCATEMTTEDDIRRLGEALSGAARQ
ncbi:MAG: aminomethyl-transferring glycine dehydrogenase subunit GcvPA [Verrucomicrobia bacterium]|nr:aminomethyl-transferring glycine dehydrogenase subunit GcvPA [Verrucomicrobiota bacterium]